MTAHRDRTSATQPLHSSRREGGLDTTTTTIGRFAFHVIAATDEFLADLIPEVTLEASLAVRSLVTTP